MLSLRLDELVFILAHYEHGAGRLLHEVFGHATGPRHAPAQCARVSKSQ